MSRISPLLIVMVFLCAKISTAGELPTARPEAVGLSPQKLDELKPALMKLVDEGKIAGGVALVARHGKVAYLEPFGVRDLESKEPMTVDTIFAIASMTKPITCVAAMQLIEKGKLNLDDPVDRYIPELKGLRVLGEAKDDTDEAVATVPAKRPITVRDLLTHTSGLAYGGLLAPNARLKRIYEAAHVQNYGLESLAEQMRRLAKVPLAHQPGEGWTYGLNHDVLGRVIEVAAGQTLDRYLEETIFRPLDMRDTFFQVPEARRDRVATIYRKGDDGKLSPLPRGYGSATFFSGGGGLFSTARDYARFCEMLRNRGELDGARILKGETLAAMTTNQIGRHNALFLYKYGLGFGIERNLLPPRGGADPASSRYFWGGIFSTYFYIDQKSDLFGIVLTQLLPTGASGVEGLFRQRVDAAIAD